MNVGFTGTQIGMSQHQKEQFVVLLMDLQPTEFHHGDCIGADDDAHAIVKEFFPDVKIHIHPPSNTQKQAFNSGDIHNVPKPYLDRNKDIVSETHVLIGVPKEDEEQLRSGTWSTIRYAKKLKREVYILKR